YPRRSSERLWAHARPRRMQPRALSPRGPHSRLALETSSRPCRKAWQDVLNPEDAAFCRTDPPLRQPTRQPYVSRRLDPSVKSLSRLERDYFVGGRTRGRTEDHWLVRPALYH